MDQKLFRVLILRCFLLRKNTVQAKQWLEKYYEDSAPSETTIKQSGQVVVVNEEFRLDAATSPSDKPFSNGDYRAFSNLCRNVSAANVT
ncbi:hypothetical protein GWI33_017772 [Rhynchophorus ferrugineus]|uniref:Uncharacterized protein n=1 Tax=Rhynchophorus ferrugineus TaxID=354439 RepID=A0A834M241_RHYFE|nr:hypothetical protein GWI33_017772 [Rhynchophorus ferrugineus]